MITDATAKTVRDLRAEFFQVEDWNRDHADGTHVIWTTINGKTLTQTRGKALLINGVAYVYLIGVHGAKPLAEVSPCYCRWVKLNRRNRINHWVFGAWESAEAMREDIDRQISRDRSIVSHEISNLKPAGAA